MSSPISSELIEVATRVKKASYALASASGEQKRAALEEMSRSLQNHRDEIIRANDTDLERGRRSGLTGTQLDRLTLDEKRFAAMVSGVEEVASLAEIVGDVVSGYVLPNGLRVRRIRVPLGVVAIVYENRPNVTADAAALCIKSGNGALLRGSSHAITTNVAIEEAISFALVTVGLPEDCVKVIKDTSREGAVEFMRLNGYIDCLIPRGGPSLIVTIKENATVPYVLDGDGNCHLYVDRDCDVDMARSIAINAKMQRPGVCNALETLLVHEEIAPKFLPDLASDLTGVEIRGDQQTLNLVSEAVPAIEEDYAKEFLDLILAVRVVKDIDEAIAHIRRYSSGHSEAIVTNDLRAADRFKREVDAAAVLVNASTRFVDGNQLGLGAEIGISTQKLHARGPMGLEALTCTKYVIEGDGHVRK